MIFTVVLIAMIVAPVLLLMLLKTNASIVFLSLCTGFVLLKFINGEVTLAVATVMPHARPPVISVAQVAVLVLPALLSAVLLSRSVTGPRALTNLIPAAAFGLLTALLVVPLLPGGVQFKLTQTQPWNLLHQMQDFIAGVGIVLSLLTLWATHHRHPSHDKKKHH